MYYFSGRSYVENFIDTNATFCNKITGGATTCNGDARCSYDTDGEKCVSKAMAAQIATAKKCQAYVTGDSCRADADCKYDSIFGCDPVAALSTTCSQFKNCRECAANGCAWDKVNGACVAQSSAKKTTFDSNHNLVISADLTNYKLKVSDCVKTDTTTSSSATPVDCSTLTSCKTCTPHDGCKWCGNQEKCMDSSSKAACGDEKNFLADCSSGTNFVWSYENEDKEEEDEEDEDSSSGSSKDKKDKKDKSKTDISGNDADEEDDDEWEYYYKGIKDIPYWKRPSWLRKHRKDKTPSTQQGKEYNKSNPTQECPDLSNYVSIDSLPDMNDYVRKDTLPDMSKYVRKDSIPCWNCSLP